MGVRELVFFLGVKLEHTNKRREGISLVNLKVIRSQSGEGKKVRDRDQPYHIGATGAPGHSQPVCGVVEAAGKLGS